MRRGERLHSIFSSPISCNQARYHKRHDVFNTVLNNSLNGQPYWIGAGQPRTVLAWKISICSSVPVRIADVSSNVRESGKSILRYFVSG